MRSATGPPERRRTCPAQGGQRAATARCADSSHSGRGDVERRASCLHTVGAARSDRGPCTCRDPAPWPHRTSGTRAPGAGSLQVHGWAARAARAGRRRGMRLRGSVRSTEESRPLTTLTLSSTGHVDPGPRPASSHSRSSHSAAVRGVLGVPVSGQVPSGAGVVSALPPGPRAGGGRWAARCCGSWPGHLTAEVGTLRAPLLTSVFPGPARPHK